jgi:hypothetical protein
MNVRSILRAAKLPLPWLAERTGLKLGSLKQLSAGNDNAGPGARQKIASAFREHADTLDELADTLERGE